MNKEDKEAGGGKKKQGHSKGKGLRGDERRWENGKMEERYFWTEKI